MTRWYFFNLLNLHKLNLLTFPDIQHEKSTEITINPYHISLIFGKIYCNIKTEENIIEKISH